VQHKRDRSFCFIRVTREEAPRLLTVFEVGPDATHFGPFHGPLRVRELVREISDVLELRDCARATPVRFADQLDLFAMERSPLCLRADVGRCLAPCAGRCTRGEYAHRVAAALSFLEGNADRPLAVLRARMERASAAMNYEYAAILRDRIARLQMARDELVALRGIMESLSFVYEPDAWAGAPQHVYLVHRGWVHEEWPSPRTAAERQRIVERAEALFRRRHATAAVQSVQAAEILLLARWFRLRPDELHNVWEEPRPQAREGLARLRGLG
jgi:excinuclease ABC subunit C